MSGRTLSLRELNRATLARQGLLDRASRPLVSAVEELGAIQAQDWAAPPVGLWSRLAGFTTDELYRALTDGELVTGTLLRGTLHLTSAAHHVDYATVATEAGHSSWRRVTRESGPADAKLRAALLAHLATARDDDELVAFLESWADAHPGAVDDKELEFQRSTKWRPMRSTCDVLRVPADGSWGSRKPTSYLAPPVPVGGAGAPAEQEALEAVIRRYLAAFGPAGVDDVSTWTGVKTGPVKSTLDTMDDLERYADESGRVLFDVPGAPLPGEVEAPVRFLPQFDSTVLAYAIKRKVRVVPEEYRAKIYTPGNLRYKPIVLVDGFVAGVWAAETKRGAATVRVTTFTALDKANGKALEAEGEELARFLTPKAKSHQVVVE